MSNVNAITAKIREDLNKSKADCEKHIETAEQDIVDQKAFIAQMKELIKGYDRQMGKLNE